MVKQRAALDFQGREILDMGRGTGIFAILAFKLGSMKFTGIDVDPWSFENSPENAQLNGISEINFLHGDVGIFPTKPFYDIISVNINRSILLGDWNRYFACLKEGGIVVLSGYYYCDEEKLTAHYLAVGLNLIAREQRMKWASLLF